MVDALNENPDNFSNLIASIAYKFIAVAIINFFSGIFQVLWSHPIMCILNIFYICNSDYSLDICWRKAIATTPRKSNNTVYIDFYHISLSFFYWQYVNSILRQEIGWFDTCGAGEMATKVADLCGIVSFPSHFPPWHANSYASYRNIFEVS